MAKTTMTKDVAIRMVKVLNSKILNSDFDFEKSLTDAITFENWAVDDVHLLTWEEVDAITA